jgi:kynurenine formamidase
MGRDTRQESASMHDGLIRYDLSLEGFFTIGPMAEVITRPVIPRREGQPVFMRGEVGIREDGRLRPLVAHNTTHVDVPLHFFDGREDLDAVLNNPAYRLDLPMLARVLDLSTWSRSQDVYAQDGIRYCERITAEMLPSLEDLRQYHALIVLTGFGALMRRGPAHVSPDADGFYHLPYLTIEAAQRVADAGLALLAIDGPTVEPQTQGTPYRMASDVHLTLLGHAPPVFILEGIAGDRLASRVGFLPGEGMLQVIPRRANAKGADAAQSRAFLSFYPGAANRQRLGHLIEMLTPQRMYG